MPKKFIILVVDLRRLHNLTSDHSCQTSVFESHKISPNILVRPLNLTSAHFEFVIFLGRKKISSKTACKKLLKLITDLRNISEERDDSAIPDNKSGDSKLIDFSPEQARTEKWMEECLHEQELQYDQLVQQQIHQKELQHEHEQNGQSNLEQTKLSPEKQVHS